MQITTTGGESPRQKKGDNMREYLFRGKREKTDAWIYGNLWHHTDKASAIYSGEADRLMWVRPETVGLFTGLTDKNGAKVFEGDVIRVCTDGQNVLGWVSFESNGFHFRFCKSGKALLAKWAEPMDVIGNIYDNPELLEELK